MIALMQRTSYIINLSENRLMLIKHVTSILDLMYLQNAIYLTIIKHRFSNSHVESSYFRKYIM